MTAGRLVRVPPGTAGPAPHNAAICPPRSRLRVVQGNRFRGRARAKIPDHGKGPADDAHPRSAHTTPGQGRAGPPVADRRCRPAAPAHRAGVPATTPAVGRQCRRGCPAATCCPTRSSGAPGRSRSTPRPPRCGPGWFSWAAVAPAGTSTTCSTTSAGPAPARSSRDCNTSSSGSGGRWRPHRRRRPPHCVSTASTASTASTSSGGCCGANPTAPGPGCQLSSTATGLGS